MSAHLIKISIIPTQPCLKYSVSGQLLENLVMGLHDIIPPTLLAKEDKQPFLLVKLRIKQKDVDFSQEKVVLRAGTVGDFKV